MACRGWYTALLPEEDTVILKFGSVDERVRLLNSIYDAADLDKRRLSVDKSWDAMHRVLCDGWLDRVHGEPALRACVIGGRQLSNRRDWIISYVEPRLVCLVDEAISKIEQGWFRDRYFSLAHLQNVVPANRYPEVLISEQDFDYTWSFFTDVQEFYARAKERGLSTIFAADQ